MRKTLSFSLVLVFLMAIAGVAQAAEFTGITVDSWSSHLQWEGPTSRHPDNTINEYGLHYNGPDTHTVWPQDAAWTSDWNAPIADQYITYDMGAQVNPATLLVRIWNNNEPGWLHAGVRDLDILVSADNISFTSLGVSVLAQGPALNDVDYSEVFSFSPGSPFQYVKFDVLANHGAAEVVGLAEVKFYADEIPEPASMLILAVGSVLACRRRRRQLH